MIDAEVFRQLALSLPGTSEKPHFNKVAFLVKKKIFATLDSENLQATLKLNLFDQNVFSNFNRPVIWPVPNKWGKQGWTFINLADVAPDILADALSTAFNNVAAP